MGSSESIHGFPRKHRLLTAADYSVVFKKSKRVSDRYWTILVHSSDCSTPRLGLAIAKKRAKRAVDRNRLKRLVRETFRARSSMLCGKQLVVMNRDETVKTDSSVLRGSLEVLLSRT